MGFIAVNILFHSSNLASEAEKNYLKLKLVDENTQPGLTITSVDRLSNLVFREFASRLIEGLVGAEGTAHRFQGLDLTIARLPVVASGDKSLAPIPVLEPVRNQTCRISSPWAEISARVGEISELRAIFLFNERQILQDQVVLDDMITVGTAPPVAHSRSEFNHWASLFSEIALHDQSTNESLVGQDFPIDLLLLFRISPQSTRGPFYFAAESKMRILAERSSNIYAELGAFILSECVSNDSEIFQTIESVRELPDFHEALRSNKG